MTFLYCFCFVENYSILRSPSNSAYHLHLRIHSIFSHILTQTHGVLTTHIFPLEKRFFAWNVTELCVFYTAKEESEDMILMKFGSAAININNPLPTIPLCVGGLNREETSNKISPLIRFHSCAVLIKVVTEGMK